MRPDFYQIAQDAVGQYLTMEDWGARLVVFPDAEGQPGTFSCGFVPSGTEFVTVVASVPCPGIGNLDSTEFTEGFAEWDEEEDAYVTVGDSEVAGRVVGNLRELILECVEYGDVSRFTEDLQEKLENDYRNQMLSEADCD